MQNPTLDNLLSKLALKVKARSELIVFITKGNSNAQVPPDKM